MKAFQCEAEKLSYQEDLKKKTQQCFSDSCDKGQDYFLTLRFLLKYSLHLNWIDV